MDTKNTIIIPLLPLRGLVVFPNMILHFDVARDRSIKALDAAMSADQCIFLTTQKDIRVDAPTGNDVYRVGTVAKIRQILRLPNDGMRVLTEGLYRAEMISCAEDGEYASATVCELTEKEANINSVQNAALLRRAEEDFTEYAASSPKLAPEVLLSVAAARGLGSMADAIAQALPVHFEQKQGILSEMNQVRRLRGAVAILERETSVLHYEMDLQQKTNDHMEKQQHDYYLREQMSVIRTELGEGEDVIAESDEYKAKIRDLHLSEDNEVKLLKEAERLASMQFGSAEAGVIRAYLDHCIELPWNSFTQDRIDIDTARKMLDADHFGLKKVKQRILEFLSVKKLAPEMKGQVLCLVGPPGVGKTSIALSIGRAMGRKTARLSLGGVRDEADIRGHRKTYIGAMPGRIMNAIAQSHSSNPVLILDEIDKMASDFRGAPASALLEVFDSEQNKAFRDHFIELPFDLSDVLFITTANDLKTIPRPLLDRMDVIELPTYTDMEKLAIAKDYLVKKQLPRHGLNGRNLRFTDDGICAIISGYTRESGVRQLEREIAAICRKTAMQIAEDGKKSHLISENNLTEYLGNVKFIPEEKPLGYEIGIINGLAYTSVGGELLPIEAAVMPGTGKVEMTGSLGDVMKESIAAAMTFVRSKCLKYGIAEDFYKTKDIHLHFPESAVPKDGPSAGVGIVCAIVSALSGAPARRDIAMTGEVSIRGKVTAIGGLSEKSMGALRAGVTTIIIPKDNERDLSEIDPEVTGQIRYIPVGSAEEAIELTLDLTSIATEKKPAVSHHIPATESASMITVS